MFLQKSFLTAKSYLDAFKFAHTREVELVIRIVYRAGTLNDMKLWNTIYTKKYLTDKWNQASVSLSVGIIFLYTWLRVSMSTSHQPSNSVWRLQPSFSHIQTVSYHFFWVYFDFSFPDVFLVLSWFPGSLVSPTFSISPSTSPRTLEQRALGSTTSASEENTQRSVILKCLNNMWVCGL